MAEHRLYALRQMANVDLYVESPLGAQDVLDFGFDRVVIATGAYWRRDGIGRFRFDPLDPEQKSRLTTPDDVFNGTEIGQNVVIYDEDGGYLGNVLAEKLQAEGREVSYVTPHADVAPYLALTMEQHKVIARLGELGVKIHRLRVLGGISSDEIRFNSVL